MENNGKWQLQNGISNLLKVDSEMLNKKTRIRIWKSCMENKLDDFWAENWIKSIFDDLFVSFLIWMFFSNISFLGPPSSKPHFNYGPPPKPQYSGPSLKPFYGPPIKPAVNFKPPQTYGPPPQQNFGPPPQQTYGLPPAPIRQPLQSYGPPSSPSFPKPIHGAGCDGWKPIPGPSFGTQAIANSNIAAIHSTLPENSYLPPQSNSLPSADVNLHVQPLPNNLQLPHAEASNFNNDEHLGASIASGLGLTSFNVVKSEGIEVCSFSRHFLQK